MDGGGWNQLHIARVRIVAESPDVWSSLMQDWGERSPAEAPESRQKILPIRQIPFLVIVDVLDSRPTNPTDALRGCHALLLVFREDVPRTYQYIENLCRAMDSDQTSKHAFRSMIPGVVGLQGGGPGGPQDERGDQLARSIGAGNFYRLSGVGTAVGLDAILEDFVLPLFESHYGPPPGLDYEREPQYILERPSRVRRLFSRLMGR